jgi:phosphoglucomutase
MTMTLEITIQNKIDTWLTGNYDEETKAEIRRLQTENQTDALADAFYQDLEFGTGGLRGIMGVGSNRMNRYTLGMATQGLSNYLLKSFPDQEIKVAIAHDSRNNSTTFAEIVANVFSANGITVYFFEGMRPTPELSFTIRELGCQSGVVLTASHNPKEYNGYKAYWTDGAQVTAPHDKNIIAEVNAITSVDEVKFEGNPEKIKVIGAEMDEAYLDKVAGLSVSKEAIHRQHNLKIVYTPLHGTGITMVPRALQRVGFSNINLVEEQAIPDGNFPTVVYPNPEEKEAMTLALKKAQEIDADIVLATDPDADRVAAAVKNLKGEFELLNGNQTGSLITYYLLNAWKKAGKIKGNEYVVNTIVTTDLINKIAEKMGVKCYETLTGFKYIAAIIREQEQSGDGATYICGGEESYGFMIGDFIRDKDGVSSCTIVAEMAAVAKEQGKTLFEMMLEMYQEYGFYKEELISITKKGMNGAKEIAQMMSDLRANPPMEITGSKVVELRDFKTGKIRNLVTGEETNTTTEPSNVLQFLLADGTKISARPSGTEPKIKFYFSVNEPLNSVTDFDKVNQQLTDKINAIISEMKLK